MQSLRLVKEYNDLQKNPIKGVEIKFKNKDNNLDWQIFLDGPEGTPYEGGTFQIDADFNDNYPFKPPKCSFATKIYHPNVRKDGDNIGEICRAIYEDQWVPTKKIRDVIQIFQTLLTAPNLDAPLEAEIGKQFLSDKPAFDKTCKEWVEKHAKKK